MTQTMVKNPFTDVNAVMTLSSAVQGSMQKAMPHRREELMVYYISTIVKILDENPQIEIDPKRFGFEKAT